MMHNLELTAPQADAAAPQNGPLPTIPFEMAVLPNGLTLIVHEDRRHPLICTQLRFNVGSKDEPAGRTGFAHLFEHLMFKESTNRRGNWHQMLQAMGGIGVNGTTNLDRTNYYQTVPTAALDQLLWMESDRMGHLLGGIDAATLADEVAVVKNEKRQREGEPYGGVFEAITTALYPKEHPYGHTVLGSFEDLDNANLETVADWHARWYGASNAVLVLSGDIGFEEALEKVEYWFGGIPAGTPARRATQWLPEVRETKHLTLFDRVPFRRIYSVWSTPNGQDIDSSYLQAIGAILSGGVYSRLYRRLVEDEKLCLSISANQDERYLCSEFQIVATLLPDADPAAVEAAISAELQRFMTDGPTLEEMERLRRAGRRNMLGMLDGIGQITELLAANMITYGRPDGHQQYVEMLDRATPEMLRDAAARWLSRKALELDVRPFTAVAEASDKAERSVAPDFGEIHAPKFPKVERAKLANGLSIQFARTPATHGANFALYLDNGAQLDPADMLGLSAAALATMDAGTQRRTKHELAMTFAENGIGYGAGVQNEFATLTMGALKGDIPEAMKIMAEILLQPVFPEGEVQMFLDRQIAGARGRGVSAGSAAGIAMSKLVFGPDHDYGRRGAGTVEQLSRITLDAIKARHSVWLDPSKATLVLVGDFELDRVVEMAEAAFGDWKPSGSQMPGRNSILAPSPGMFFISRPGSGQSTVRGAMASSEITLGRQDLNIFNLIFGGAFSSRINANLRERKGWTYGANSSFSVHPQIGTFGIGTDVQADRTMDSLEEIQKELKALLTDRPITQQEIEDARHALLVGLPSAWVGGGAVLNMIVQRIVYGLSDGFEDGIEAAIRGVTAEDVNSVAELVGDPAKFSWLVAGDPASVAADQLTVIDEEANRL